MSFRSATTIATLALTMIACGEGAGDIQDGTTTTATTAQALGANDNNQKLIDDLDLLPVEGKASSEEDVEKVGAADGEPGTYHVLLTNYLGLMKQSFAEDRTFDDEVWSAPVTGYRITNPTKNGTLTELPCKAAVKILHEDRDSGDKKRHARFASSHAERCFDVELDVILRDDQKIKRRLRYILGAHADGVVFAGEWLGPSVACHPGACPKDGQPPK